MKKCDFEVIAQHYFAKLPVGRTARLSNLLGSDPPAYPGKWLFEMVNAHCLDTLDYRVEWNYKDYSDVYIKIANKPQCSAIWIK